MYTLYKTDAFVLKAKTSGESNKLIHFFTKDLGVIFAHVQGIRNLSSKLRFSLQDGSYVRVTFVRGRAIWRVTNAEEIKSFSNLHTNIEKREVSTRIFHLFYRLYQAETPNERLFNDLLESLTFFDSTDLSEDERKNFEVIMALKILWHLGYLNLGKKIVGNSDILSFVAVDTKLHKSLLQQIQEIRQQAISTINKSILESQL